MAKQFQAELERDAALGLSTDEIAFYDALVSNESAVRELGDETLKKIAVEITDKLRKSTTVDWQVRESVLQELAKYGAVNVRHAHGNWNGPQLGGWIEKLHSNAMQVQNRRRIRHGRVISCAAIPFWFAPYALRWSKLPMMMVGRTRAELASTFPTTALSRR